MALTPSTMLPLGTRAPEFRLWCVIDETHYHLDDLKSDKATVLGAKQVDEVEKFLKAPAEWSAAHGGVSSFPSS